MYLLSCDLGINGGFAFFENDKVIRTIAMPRYPDSGPIDTFIMEWFFHECKSIAKLEDIKVVYERVWGQVGSGTKQLYSFGLNNGVVQGLLQSHFKVKQIEVLPRTWQKWLFAHCNVEEQKRKDGKRDTKKMTLDAVTKLYPKIDLRQNTRCKKAHDGIVDAIGIGVYTKGN